MTNDTMIFSNDTHISLHNKPLVNSTKINENITKHVKTKFVHANVTNVTDDTIAFVMIHAYPCAALHLIF